VIKWWIGAVFWLGNVHRRVLAVSSLQLVRTFLIASPAGARCFCTDYWIRFEFAVNRYAGLHCIPTCRIKTCRASRNSRSLIAPGT